MEDIRCASCARKLGRGDYTIIEIKCPRCGAINTLRVKNPEPERLRASPDGATGHDDADST